MSETDKYLGKVYFPCPLCPCDHLGSYSNGDFKGNAKGDTFEEYFRCQSADCDAVYDWECRTRTSQSGELELVEVLISRDSSAEYELSVTPINSIKTFD